MQIKQGNVMKETKKLEPFLIQKFSVSQNHRSRKSPVELRRLTKYQTSSRQKLQR